MNEKGDNGFDCCKHCPHLDQFHSACSHPRRQTIVRELRATNQGCPVFTAVRAEAMSELADSLDDLSRLE